MARITGAADERVFQIQRWLGLAESPDGDTKLKMGEAARMQNFRITRDGNLQKRPGRRGIITVEADKPIDAVWTDGQGVTLVICNKKLYKLNGDLSTATQVSGGTFNTVSSPHMFAFGGKVYILNGGTSASYYVYDGSSMTEVAGYTPLVMVDLVAAGTGELLEQVNKLTAKRRVWLSPDGAATSFQLPEKDLDSIDSATLTADGSTVTIDTGNTSPANGIVAFTTAPAAGSSTIEVTYTAKTDYRSDVTGMKFSETYNGALDTRVFLYGDGSDTAIYSDVNYNGEPSAEYFPDMNVVKVGATGTPITAMIRHYGSLAVFKTDGAYNIGYGAITLADGSEIGAFYVTPVNATIGNEAPGQAQLVLNSPVTLFGQDVYEWTNSSYYTSNLTRDERQAKRKSDRVYATLHQFDTKNAITFDDNYNQEYYICDTSGQALVWNYAADAWYFYNSFPMYRPFSYKNELYYGGTDGTIYHVSTDYFYDGNADSTVLSPIFGWYESGSMSFGQDYKRKFSAELWIGFKPVSRSSVYVTAKTDRTGSLPEKETRFSITGDFDFDSLNFEHISFEVNDKPQIRRLKIKAKKFSYYKIIFKTQTNDTSVTITAADIRVRFTGTAK